MSDKAEDRRATLVAGDDEPKRTSDADAKPTLDGSRRKGAREGESAPLVAGDHPPENKKSGG